MRSRWVPRLVHSPTVAMSLLLALGLMSCRSGPAREASGLAGPGASDEAALETIQADEIKAYLSFLADDALEGRRTGTRGFDVAATYLRSQLASFGATGGAADGGYFQDVPLVRTRVDGAATGLTIEGQGASHALVCNEDFLLMDTHREAEGSVSGRVVFVGYGVTAPEMGYDDYAGLDVRGAIVAYLVFESPPSFSPTIRAYYSSHEVKRRIAAEHGAIGAIYIATPSFQSKFPWEFIKRERSIGMNSMRWLGADGIPSGLDDGIRLVAFMNRSGAEALFSGENPSLAEVFEGAEKGELPRFALSKSVTAHWRADHEPVHSVNIVGRFEGSDPALRDEVVLYTAHADHLGIGPEVDGDTIYNGAIDNGAGCSDLLAIARAVGSLPERPARSIMFLFVTGEEAGLLGSDYFAHNPTVPVDDIVANLNIDGGASLTPVSDVLAQGAEHSSLGPLVERAASRAGFTVGSDPFPDEGSFVRSDQFSFVKKGVPALFLDVGVTSTEPGVDGLEVLKKWLVTNYHSPQDDLSQPIQYGTSAQFARFAFTLGEEIANAPERPRWNDGDFFGKTFGRGVPEPPRTEP